MEERFILGQQALTPDGAVYQIIWDEPYNVMPVTPDLVAQQLARVAPENTIEGSTCIYNTEDADGYPVEWLFAFDGSDWALDRVIRGGSAGGGGGEYKTAQVEFILDGISSAGVYGAFAERSGFVSGKKTISSTNHGASVLCASNGAPSELQAWADYKFVASQGNIEIASDSIAYVQGDGTITIGDEGDGTITIGDGGGR